MDRILEDAKQSGLSPYEIRRVQGAYAGGLTDILGFYRIVNFEDARSS